MSGPAPVWPAGALRCHECGWVISPVTARWTHQSDNHPEGWVFCEECVGWSPPFRNPIAPGLNLPWRDDELEDRGDDDDTPC